MKRLDLSCLNKITNFITKIDLNRYSSNSIFSRRVINYLLQFENPEIYLRNIHTVTGFRKANIKLANISQNKIILRIVF